jgi:hypothetical protein
MTCPNSVELRGFGPLTYSTRTSQLERLSWLARALESLAVNCGAQRAAVGLSESVIEATADGPGSHAIAVHRR